MIAITGAAGITGQYLTHSLLKSGEHVKLLVNDPDSFSNFKDFSGQFQLIEGNVKDISSLDELLNGVEVVYHLEEEFDFSDRSKVQLYKVNVEGTANVINFSLKHEVKKVIFKSSILAIGDKRENKLHDEHAKWNDIDSATSYGWSKHLAEREVWRGETEGLNVLIVNAGWAFHPGEWKQELQPLFSSFFDHGKCAPTGLVPIIDTQDLVQVMISLAKGEESNEQFIVFSDQISYHELLKMISKLGEIENPVNELPYLKLLNRAKIQRLKFWNRGNKKQRLSVSIAKLFSDKRIYSNAKFKQIYSTPMRQLNETIDRSLQHQIEYSV